MSPAAGFCLDWHAGASAQVEIFSPGPGQADTYQLKFTAPFRSTIRPPVQSLYLGPGELAPINQDLDQLIATHDARGGQGGGGNALGGTAVLAHALTAGNQLLNLVMPTDVQNELRGKDLFLEVGMDEALVGYPWELMHDEDEFLCLKHFMGRFVNATVGMIPAQLRGGGWLGAVSRPLSVLLISVPRPLTRQSGMQHPPLLQAEAESLAIVETLAVAPGVQFRLLKDATFGDVFNELKVGYDIIHFNGHAYFNSEKPYQSSLVLQNQDMSTGQIVAFMRRHPPVLLVMNACETAAAAPPGWKGRYDVFGLARAFLTTGAYLIGSRWKVSDPAARAFAVALYGAVLEGQPLGKAVRAARLACKTASPPDDFGWGSYVFYGDPRLCFRPNPVG